jgi:hypothetical protein
MTAIYLTDFSGITQASVETVKLCCLRFLNSCQSRQVVGDCEGTLQLHII